MCGFIGIFGSKAPEKEIREKALRMSAKIRHRGPDWSGVYSSASCTLAHERLAIIGIFCGLAMTGSVTLFDHIFHIDDPVGAISVHGVCGILGTLGVGLFATDGGLFYGGGFHFLGVQAFGVLAIVAWAFCLGWITMKVLDKTMGIRVDPRIEEEGLDIYEHDETAYNS